MKTAGKKENLCVDEHVNCVMGEDGALLRLSHVCMPDQSHYRQITVNHQNYRFLLNSKNPKYLKIQIPTFSSTETVTLLAQAESMDQPFLSMYSTLLPLVSVSSSGEIYFQSYDPSNHSPFNWSINRRGRLSIMNNESMQIFDLHGNFVANVPDAPIDRIVRGREWCCDKKAIVEYRSYGYIVRKMTPGDALGRSQPDAVREVQYWVLEDGTRMDIQAGESWVLKRPGYPSVRFTGKELILAGEEIWGWNRLVICAATSEGDRDAITSLSFETVRDRKYLFFLLVDNWK